MRVGFQDPEETQRRFEKMYLATSLIMCPPCCTCREGLLEVSELPFAVFLEFDYNDAQGCIFQAHCKAVL